VTLGGEWSASQLDRVDQESAAGTSFTECWVSSRLSVEVVENKKIRSSDRNKILGEHGSKLNPLSIKSMYQSDENVLSYVFGIIQI